MKENQVPSLLRAGRCSWLGTPVCYFAFFSLFLLGCGSDLPTTVPVSGKVTFGAGDCLAEGTVTFLPLEAAPGYTLHPGSAAFDRDGSFSVSSFKGSEGLVPGRYQPRIDCWKTLPSVETDSPGESYVPEGHQLEELVVPDDSRKPIYLEYDIPTS